MAPKKKTTLLRTPADIKKAWQELEAQMDKHRKEHEGRGDAFASITRQQFEAKLKRVNSPMIVSQGWSPSAPPGGTISYGGLIRNWDVWTYTNLALVLFVGNRNPIVSNEEFLTGYDTRFPTYAQPAPNGFTIPSAQYSFFSMQVTIPLGVERTGYFGNCSLQKISFLDVGTCLDRACFFFDVV